MLHRGGIPDPDKAADLTEFIGLLGELRAWAGQPSYRTLAKRVGPLMRPAQTVAPGTVVDMFKVGRRRLRLDLVVAIVRALGVDEAGVTRWREACVRVHIDAKAGGPAGVFRQLPADLAVFTGRESELERLVEAATAPASGVAPTVVISAIEGMAGVGKTQLALHAAHRLVRAGRFAETQLFVNLHGFDPDQPPTDPASVLDAFLRQLDVAPAKIPAERQERAAMFRHLMDGRDALIVLDNAVDAEQVRDLIPGSPSCLVLVTSRNTLAALPGALIQLGVFTLDEAVALLAQIAGTERVRAEPQAAARIAELCGCLPLAVSLAAARLRSRPAWSISHLVERLQSGGLDGIGAGRQGIRQVFNQSYQDLHGLPQRLFCLLGIWPGRDIGTPAAAALVGISAAETESALEELVDAHLLESPAPFRYQFHDLLKLYAAELAVAEHSPQSRQQAAKGVLAWYLHAVAAAMDVIAPQRRPVEIQSMPGTDPAVPAFDAGPAAMAWCDAERTNLIAGITLAYDYGLDDIAWQLPIILQYYLSRALYLNDFIASHRIGLRAAERAASDEGRARLLHGMAAAYRIAGRYSEAIASAQLMLDLHRQTGDERGERAALDTLALTWQASGENQRAIEIYLQALALERDADDTFGVSSVLNNLGVAYHGVHRLDDAVACFQESFELSEALGNSDGMAYTLDSLGQVAATRGNHRQAIGYFGQAIRLLESTGNRGHRAEFLEHLAQSHRALGEDREAEWALSQATTVERPEGAVLSRLTVTGNVDQSDSET